MADHVIWQNVMTDQSASTRADLAESRLYTAVALRLKAQGFSPRHDDIRYVHLRILGGEATGGGIVGRAIEAALREGMGENDQQTE